SVVRNQKHPPRPHRAIRAGPMSPSEACPTWMKRLRKAKKLHRPSLKDWGRDGYAPGGRKSSSFEQLASQRHLERHGQIACVDQNEISQQEFWDQFERPGIPCIIRNVAENEGWAAQRTWTLDQLKKSKVRRVKMKCGEDDDGYSVKVRLKHFFQYMRHESLGDDSPLYVFDSHFDSHPVAKCLLEDFSVPSYFSDDLFSLVGERRRPPYRWFLVGPKRSGTCVHIDPLGTSAWNTVLQGKKLWVLFPPDTPKRLANGEKLIGCGPAGTRHPSLLLFFYPLLLHGASPHPLPMLSSSYHCQVIEFIQGPGETVYIPGGWWHGVLNLEDSIAVTQNFCSKINFDMVWCKTRMGRPKMSVKWLERLDEKRPELAARARELNERDSFVMRSKGDGGERQDSAEKKKRKKEERKADEGAAKKRKKE
ncbi:unnamed protein product, partial [Chrysoparadoxa australica]